jgi:hypothetical protein
MADDVPLREYVEALLNAQQKAVEAALEASDKAITKAETNAEKWRDNANEWRGQSADRERTQAEQIATLTATFLPREVAEAQLVELRKQTSMNTERLNRLQSEKRGIDAFQAVTLDRIIALAAVLSLIAFVVVHG